ncbi:MAG: SurA N-terminal domain-containing protein [Candidatus Omnitrophica bacterium]|nr:SurA N-terminal domain-containing protein [Candidatus Omnitrophota bacterium]
MLRFLRKKKNLKRVYWILAILIIPSFIWWGVGGSIGRQERGLVAKVNRTPITKRDYYTTLERLNRNYRVLLGDKFSEEMAKKLNLEKKALDMLIREKLLSQEIRRQKIRVKDSEVSTQIKRDPTFLDKEGKFDAEKFRRIVERIPANELRQMEEEVKKSLLLQKLEERVLSSLNIEVTDKEITDYRKANKVEKKVDEKIIRQILLFQKSQKALDEWYKNLKAEAKIKVWLSEEGEGG